jgi:hypothetical protein
MLLSVLLSKNQPPSAVTPALAAGVSVCGKKFKHTPHPRRPSLTTVNTPVKSFLDWKIHLQNPALTVHPIEFFSKGYILI